MQCNMHHTVHCSLVAVVLFSYRKMKEGRTCTNYRPMNIATFWQNNAWNQFENLPNRDLLFYREAKIYLLPVDHRRSKSMNINHIEAPCVLHWEFQACLKRSFDDFWRTVHGFIHKIQWFPLSMLIFDQNILLWNKQMLYKVDGQSYCFSVVHTQCNVMNYEKRVWFHGSIRGKTAWLTVQPVKWSPMDFLEN